MQKCKRCDHVNSAVKLATFHRPRSLCPRLSEARAGQRDGSTRASPPQSAGGFVKIVDERRGSPEEPPDLGVDRQRVSSTDGFGGGGAWRARL